VKGWWLRATGAEDIVRPWRFIERFWNLPVQEPVVRVASGRLASNNRWRGP
jgi:hypothetical protein